MLRAFHGEPGAVADIIPVDLVVNMILAAAWLTVLTKPGKVPIYHCTSGATNPITWGEVGKRTQQLLYLAFCSRFR